LTINIWFNQKLSSLKKINKKKYFQRFKLAPVDLMICLTGLYTTARGPNLKCEDILSIMKK